MERPRCSVFIATSADGYIARRDGAIDWLERVQGPDYGYAAFLASVDTLVMGRATYDTVLGFGDWPFAGKRVIVMTHRPAAPRRDETFASATPIELLAQLGNAQRIYVDGGNVIRQFLSAHLIDDVTLSIVPIVLGDGVRLFVGGEGEHALALESSQAWPTGLVQLRYRVSSVRASSATSR
ncbi:MAG TPA: dihydrofolate reductase family protein [Kofleriaceae bacterium]|nr:dihydrofolate reductase family protein [Kofleriaceae bacterium]